MWMLGISLVAGLPSGAHSRRARHLESFTTRGFTPDVVIKVVQFVLDSIVHPFGRDDIFGVFVLIVMTNILLEVDALLLAIRVDDGRGATSVLILQLLLGHHERDIWFKVMEESSSLTDATGDIATTSWVEIFMLSI